MFSLITKKIVTSKDVVFEEDKSQDWDSSFKEQIETDLTWGDDLLDDESEDGYAPQETSQIVDETANTQEESGETRRTRRTRRPSIRLRDYESGEGLSDQEGVAYMTYIEGEDK